MDAATPQNVIENCPSCGGAIDVTDELPFAQIYCPHCGEGLRARRMFNNFELLELIGQGGMGSVFRAYDHTLQRTVALKVLRREVSANAEERAKLEQEARITASVNHPHVVRVYSFGQADGQFYLAMELVEKGSLDDLMAIQDRVSEVQVLEIGLQIAAGLEAAAERGLIHRDVKPGNILFADAHTTKIVDFGLARVFEDEAEARGEIWGTPYYIAPERLNYEPEDFRSDIYSLGGTLFHAIAGRPPFEAENASLVALKQLKSQRVSLEAFAPDVAPETAYVINRMLEKLPGHRYDSYGELIEHLEFARAKVLERAGRPPARRREVVQVESSRMKLYTTLMVLGVVALLLGGTVWVVATSEAQQIREFRETLQSLWSEPPLDPFSVGLVLLGSGDYPAASERFAEAAQSSAGLPRQAPWARFNLALSLMLSGEREQARKEWTQIKSGGLFSERREDLEAANMFLYAAAFGQRDQVVTADELARYPQDDVGSLVYLVAGVTNHSLGDRDETGRVLEKFLTIKPDNAVPGWSDYRKLAERLIGGG